MLKFVRQLFIVKKNNIIFLFSVLVFKLVVYIYIYMYIYIIAFIVMFCVTRV